MGIFSSGNLSKIESPKNEILFNVNKEEELTKYTDVNEGELAVRVSQSTTTESSQYYSFAFSTVDKLFSTFRPEYKGISLSITDPAFSGDYNDYPSKPEVKPVFEAEVYSIDGASINQHIAVIPSTASFGERFDFKVTSIRSNCLVKPGDITTIFIPDSIEKIDVDSFAGISSTTTIECVSAADKSGWESGWSGGATVLNNQEDRNKAYKADKRNFSNPTTHNNGCKFYIGYYGEEEQNQPLKLVYDVEKDGVVSTRVNDFKLHSQNSVYDAVGAPLALDSVTLDIILSLNEGEKVLDDSLEICNLYGTKIVMVKELVPVKEKDSDGNEVVVKDIIDGVEVIRKEWQDVPKTVPDFDTAFKIKAKNKAERLYLNNFLNIKPISVTTIGDFTELVISADCVPGIYERVKPVPYLDNKERIDSGDCIIRYRFTNLPAASYRITYTVGEASEVKVMKVNTPVTFYNLEKDTDNRIGLLINNKDVGDNFDSANLVKIELMEFIITIDLYDKESKTVNTNYTYNVTFGSSTLYKKDVNEIKTYNLDLALTLVIIIALTLYAVGAVGLFFLFKNLFKNDEFRRLNPKSFIKKAIKFFIGYVFIVASLTAIIFRWGFLNNSIVVYNPIDAFVIIFTIGGLISLGLFIKELVVSIRVSAKRKSDKKLKIGELAEDDGTN